MRSYLSLILVTALLSLSVQAAPAKLAMLPTLEIVESSASAQDRAELVSLIKSEKVKNELIKLGVNPDEALNRVATLSASEVKKLSQQIDHAKAGGDFGVGSIVGAVLFVFIVLLITDILGFTKVFPFTRSVN